MGAMVEASSLTAIDAVGRTARTGRTGPHRIEVELPGPAVDVGAVGFVERSEGHLVVAEHRRLELLVMSDPVGVLLPP